MSSKIPIWRVKYLPNTMDDFCGREDIKEKLKNFIKEKNFPHLLFVGSEGIGKSTIARLFSKEFLGQYFDANFKLIYANVPLTQEERSQAKSDAYISTSKIGSTAGKSITTPAFIQVKVKPFVQLKVLGDVPFKILVVKNFEVLEADQQGFRRLMEIYGTNCRMILITTKISGIIEPIISRCQIFLIPPADLTSFKKLMIEIAENESIKINDDVLNILYKVSEGHLARAIDILQLSSINSNSIDLNQIYETSQKFKNELIKSLMLVALKGDFVKARDLSRSIISEFKYNPHELFNLLLSELNKLPLDEFARVHLLNLIADADFRSIDGLDSDIQISALLSKICLFSEYL